MPRILEEKEYNINNMAAVEVCCDFCGKVANFSHYDNSPGIVDWPDGSETVFWASAPGSKIDEIEEIIICYDCFHKVIRKLSSEFPKLKELINASTK